MPHRTSALFRHRLIHAAAPRARIAALAALGALAGALGGALAMTQAIAIGVAAGALAGWLAWLATAPFARLAGQAARLQAEAEALSQQLTAVLDNAQVGIVFTRDGRFELMSRHFCATFGWEASQLHGQPTRLIYSSDEAFKSFGERAAPAFIERGEFTGEVQLARSSGEALWVHARGRAVVPGDASQGTIWILDDVTQARAQRERLAWSASHDSLTGLANRAEFEHLLAQAVGQSPRRPFCALFIDLDRFKQVNDSAGHAAGDMLLRGIAQVLGTKVRQSDTVARLGGDEFAVLLPDCPTEQALAIAEKMRLAVQAHELVWEGCRYQVGASVGLVLVDQSFGSHDEVLRAADAACYAAKREGRDRVVRYAAHLSERPAAPGVQAT